MNQFRVARSVEVTTRGTLNSTLITVRLLECIIKKKKKTLLCYPQRAVRAVLARLSSVVGACVVEHNVFFFDW